VKDCNLDHLFIENFAGGELGDTAKASEMGDQKQRNSKPPCQMLSVGFFIALVSTAAFAAVNGPVKSVTLSSGGLAEIVRSAEVGNDSEITIDVPLDHIDDVLKSLIVRDGKGRVKTLSLAGPNPLDETFRTQSRDFWQK
jgi:hypothetical protein